MPEVLEAPGSLPLLSGRLSRQMLREAASLTMPQIRGLVDSYYEIQDYRKSGANRHRAVSQGVDAHPLVDYVVDRLQGLEKDIARIMAVATDAHAPSKWAKSLVGIGPVLAAGLLAHIDITQSPTVSSLWRYAGYDPTCVWEKGQKRPWNARLKVLGWKCGQSFMKFSNHRNATLYSQLYRERKAREQARTEAGLHAEVAAHYLASKRFRTGTEAFKAYEQGRLPKGQIDARARRYAVKIFLSHFWNVCYMLHFQRTPPLPYIAMADPAHHAQHLDRYAIPNWPMEDTPAPPLYDLSQLGTFDPQQLLEARRALETTESEDTPGDEDDEALEWIDDEETT